MFMDIKDKYHKGTSFRQEPEFNTQSITEKPMEVYYQDEWFVIKSYVCWPTTSSNILKVDRVLLKEVWKLLVALFHVPNALTVYFRF